MPNDELFENYNTKGGPRVGYRYGYKMDFKCKRQARVYRSRCV